MTDLWVSSNFDDRTVVSPQQKNHHQYEKKSHPPYLIYQKPDRVEQSDDCAKEFLTKDSTTSILQQGAPYRHESSINPCHPDSRMFYAIALVDKIRRFEPRSTSYT